MLALCDTRMRQSVHELELEVKAHFAAVRAAATERAISAAGVGEGAGFYRKTLDVLGAVTVRAHVQASAG